MPAAPFAKLPSGPSLAAGPARIRSADGEADAYVSRPAGAGPLPGVLLFCDAAGLRPSIFQAADRIAARGFHVLAPDPYYRTPADPPLNVAEVFAHGPDWARMNAMRDALGHADMGRDAAAWLGALAEQATSPLACVGMSFGGRFALAAAGAHPNVVAFAASIHGGALATDAPDSPHLALAEATAAVYVAAAETDAQCPPAQLARLRHALAEAGLRHRVEVFPGVRHGFATPESAAYDAAAAEAAWRALGGALAAAIPPGTAR